MLNQLSAILPVEAEKDFSASNWKYRRTIIFAALGVAGLVVLIFAFAVAAVMILQTQSGAAISFDRGLIGLGETLVWAMATLATSIIAAYVFGANMDTNNFRKSVLELSNKSVVTTEIKHETTVSNPNSAGAVTKTETTQASTTPVLVADSALQTNPTGGAPTNAPKPPYDDNSAG